MEQTLKQLFLQTTNPNGSIRNSAEAQLKNLEKNIDFLNIVRNSLMKDQNKTIQQISSIYFMNSIERNWKDPEIAVVRTDIENSILNLLCSDEKYPKIAYQNILQCIFEHSEKETVINIFRESGKFLSSADQHLNKAALTLFEEVFKSDTLRFNLEDILDIMFNQFGSIFTNKFAEFVSCRKFNYGGMCMKIVSKAYSNYNIPEFLNNIDVFRGLFNMAVKITEISESNNEHFSKMHRWAVFFLYKCANKGLKKYFKSNDLVTFIREDATLEMLYTTFTNVLNAFISGADLHEKVSSICSDFFKLFASNKRTKHLIRKNYTTLISSFILPAQSFDKDIKDDFEYDSEMYLRERYNYYNGDLKSCTVELFEEILRDDKEIEVGVLTSLKNFLDLPVDDANAPTRYAIVGLAANIQSILIRHLTVDGFHKFLVQYIFADLNSQYPFLISQALYFLSLTESIDIVDNSVVEALNRIMLITNSDHEILPIEACLALNPFLYCEKLNNIFKPIIPSLFEKTLGFSKIYFLESLSTLCDSMIDCFMDEITVYAPVFVQTLCSSFMEHVDTEKDETLIAISGCLTTIGKLVMTADDKPDIIKGIYQHASAIINYVFKNKKVDFFQECFDLMNSFLFVAQSVNESMFEIFVLALSNERDELCLYPREIRDFIDNFLSYGKEKMITPKTLELIYNSIDMFMPLNSSEAEVYDEDFEAACGIIDSLMLNAGQSVHQMNQNIIPAILHKIISNYEFAQTYDRLPVFALESIMNCFLVASDVTLVNMGSFMETFFNEIDFHKSKFTRVYDKKLLLLFIGKLFKISGALPANPEALCDVFVEMITTLPDAIKLRNKLKEKAENGEDDDEDYSDYTVEDLEEDIYFETVLDEVDAYSYIQNSLNSIQPDTFGQRLVSVMSSIQISKVKDVLETPQEAQK